MKTLSKLLVATLLAAPVYGQEATPSPSPNPYILPIQAIEARLPKDQKSAKSRTLDQPNSKCYVFKGKDDTGYIVANHGKKPRVQVIYDSNGQFKTVLVTCLSGTTPSGTPREVRCDTAPYNTCTEASLKLAENFTSQCLEDIGLVPKESTMGTLDDTIKKLQVTLPSVR